MQGKDGELGGFSSRFSLSLSGRQKVVKEEVRAGFNRVEDEDERRLGFEIPSARAVAAELKEGRRRRAINAPGEAAEMRERREVDWC